MKACLQEDNTKIVALKRINTDKEKEGVNNYL